VEQQVREMQEAMQVMVETSTQAVEVVLVQQVAQEQQV
jgi:hypothetical protein